MADTAISAGELPAQRREHLPRQQPHQPLRHHALIASAADSESRSGIRPMSLGGEGRGRDQVQYSSMGPHPGANPISRVNSIGAGTRPDDGLDHTQPSAHSRLQAKPSYLQQRATGTLGEHVFNAHDPAAPASASAARPAALTTDQHQQMQEEAKPLATQPHKASSSSRRMVGPYQLAKTIGAGSMGKVKVALDTRTNKRVAAKIIPLQQPDAPIYFPSRLDTTTSRAAREATASACPVPDGPIDASVEPWQTWLMSLALESQPDLAALVKYPVHVQRRLRLLQPRERYTTKDREQRENKDIRIVREVAINRLLHHPHICMLHDVVVHPNHYYIFQELVSGGQMLDYIISHGRLKEKHARKFARQIASAIDYCHHNSIVHRDLKIENILISANGNIKLIDFGLSNLYSPRSQLSTFCGSLYFAAPELLNAQPYTGPEVDLWSFGVVLYVLVCGKVPFDDQSMPALHAKIKRGHVEYPSWLSPECKHLLSRLLVVAHQRRATMGEIVRHPWMCKGYVESPMVNNYLPVRVPLVSPEQIDRNVVHEMAQYIGFGFGSEDEIRIGLESILTEDWYRTWLKDALTPQLETVRLRLHEQALRHNAAPTAASALALSRQEVRDTTTTANPTLSETPPLTLQHAGSSSGATLTNPADPQSHAVPPSSLRERQSHHGNSISSRQTEASGGPESLNGDSVRKRSSFWKRSSTFISGGLARASHKPASEAHASGIPGHAGHAATEKTQPGQFRVLSNRIFNDGKLGSPSGDSSASREYSASPLSPHSPRMYVDPASGMVGIWKDGKLAPLDTDCAAIQQDYHDLVATDPLLSIYYLVKERRDREAGASSRHHTTIVLSQHQSSAIPGTHATVDSASSSAAAAGVIGSKHGRQDSSETWVKLERAPDPAANATNKTRTGANKAETRQQSTSKASSSVDRNHDHATALNIAQSSGASNVVDVTHDMPMDQTTAAIEALSLHPRVRGPTQPPATGVGSASQTAAFQDSRKKRSSIFKRFSVIVKGARPSQRHPSAPLDNAAYIVQAEGGESGYMEISLDSHVSGGGSGGGDGASDYPHQNSSAAGNEAMSLPSAHLPAGAEAAGERLKGNTGGQRYPVLDSIDEGKEYVNGEDIPGVFAARIPAAAANTAPLHEPLSTALVSQSQSLDAAGRQYLAKSLTPSQSPECVAAEAPLARGIEVAGSGRSMPSVAPSLRPMAHIGAASSDGAKEPTSRYEHPQPSGCSDASRSSGDLCGASSMFTNSELDENETTLRNQLASCDGAAARGEVGSPLSEKAALLDKARREIDGFDEHEGVGLLDQTPELNYRVAGQAQGSSFDAMKRRTRSSSNTVVRVLSEIVRDGGGGPSSNSHANSRGGKRATNPNRGLRQRDTQGASSPPNTDTSGPSLPAKTIPRHNSTGAINSASGSGYFEESVLGSSAQHVLQLAETKLLSSNTSTGPPRPDILRSQSHASASRPQGFVLPERIAEVSEPPTPHEPWPENALRADAEKDSGRAMRTDLDKKARGGVSGSSALVEFKLSPDAEPPTPDDTADSDDMHDVTSAPPRADEYLKPVFLKGLFSVSTTSTRSPSAIRANLLGVLSEMPLRFHEGRGYFTCSMATTAGPSNLQEEAFDAYAQDDMTTSLSSGLHKPRRSLRLPGVDRKISFRRRVKRVEKAPRPLPHTHDGLSSNDDNLSGSRQSVADLSSDDAKDHSRPPALPPMPTVPKSANNNAICFQIFLVRMPLLGLCGLQFRRVSGPTWKYKDLCSEILKRLKL